MKKTLLHELREIVPLIKLLRSSKCLSGEKNYFGEDKEQYYILKIPPQKTKKTLTVYIHGGGFRLSSALEHNFVGNFYNDYGYINVNLCYRKTPKYKYPHAIDDVFLGLKEAINNLREKNILIEDIVITGSSAGGYLGAMICFNLELQKKYGLDSYKFKGFCSLSGLINVNYNSKNPLYKKFIKDYFKDKKDNTYDYIENYSNTDLLVIHSIHDPLVKYEETKIFYDSYKGTKKIHDVENMLHTNVCIAPFLYKEKEMEVYLEWLQKFE